MITKLYYWLEEKYENSAYGLVSGLLCGLFFGLLSLLAFVLAFELVSGLASGLAYGLVFVLAFGLVSGLASVLAFVLAYGLAYGLVSGILNLPQLIPINLFSIIILIAGIIILAEILYGFNKRQKRISWGKVIWLKTDALFSSVLITINLLNVIWIFKHIKSEQLIHIVAWISYIGAGIIVLFIGGATIYEWLLWNKKRLTK